MSRHKPISTKEPLSVTHAELAAEWHPTKNDGLTPDLIVAAATVKVWWKCPKAPDHEWQAQENPNDAALGADRELVDARHLDFLVHHDSRQGTR